jgi:transposase
MKRIPRRTFTAEFKAEAIKLVTEQKLTHAEVSKKLDIGTKSIRTWIEQQSRGVLISVSN